MSNLRILHIAPWFPNPKNDIEGVFILEHLKALNKHCYNEVLHISFGNSNFKDIYLTENIKTNRINIKTYTEKWREKEFFAGKAVNRFLNKTNERFDIVNFHIAYPNAININKLIKKHSNLKFAITEHWTAYSNSFNLQKNDKGRKRIENIFNNDIPLFVVSTALGNDIQKFIGDKNRQYTVVPNVIDCVNFKYKPKSIKKEFIFLSINNWNSMKNPFVLIKAFKLLLEKHKNIKLILGGKGSMNVQMKKLVTDLDINNSVEFVGRLTKKEVVSQLQNSHVYCQSSNYETFSVICAEALITGTPVIATRIGGMLDFINGTNGTLVDNLEVDSWLKAMESNYSNYSKIDTKQISENCVAKYNSQAVGNLYYSKLMNVFNEK